METAVGSEPNETLAAAGERLRQLREMEGFERGPAPATPDELVEAIRRGSYMARWVDAVTAADLALISTPTIVLHQSGAAELLLRSRAGRFEVAGGWSNSWIPRPFALLPGSRVLEITAGIQPKQWLLHAAALVWSHRAVYARSALCLALATTLGLAGPLAMRLVIDQALPERATLRLLGCVLGLLLLAAQRAWLSWLSQALLREARVRGQHVASRHLFRHLLALRLKELEQRSLGELVETQQRTAELHAGLQRRGWGVLLEGGTAAMNLLPLAWLAPSLAALIAPCGLALALANVLAGRAKAALVAAEWRVAAQQRGQVLETLRSQATLQVAGAMAQRFEHWLDLALGDAHLTLRRARLEATMGVVSDAGSGAALVGTYSYVGHAALAGELSIGSALAILMLADAVVRALARGGAELGGVLELAPHGQMSENLLRQEEEALPPRRRSPRPESRGPAVEFEGVWFRHGVDEPWVLEAFDFRAERGGMAQLTGRSGAGKTTALRLIAGLYQPERGTVRTLGQRPLHARRDILYVPQNVQLFQGTLLQNLRCLSANAPVESIQAALSRTGLEEWVGSLPMGLHTPIAAGGGNISGGQRQLIALTAAAASDRSLLLLDECMSHLDRPTVDYVFGSGLFERRTIVLVQHTGRDATHVI